VKILFVHQNFPGQFLHLAPELRRLGHDVRVLTDAKNTQTPDLPMIRYRHGAQLVDPAQTRLGRKYTTMSDRGVTVARGARTLRDRDGYVPDVIFGHSGWGETLFLKEVWPKAKLVVYAEFYYRGTGADVGFDPEFSPGGFDQVMIAQGRAAHLAQSIVHADLAVSPTAWQAATHPETLRSHIRVIHDGVDTDAMRPDAAAFVDLPDGRRLQAGDEVLTFVNRNLEPYRGYHIFLRALPTVMAARPDAQVVIVGGDGVSYGAAPKDRTGWKDLILDEVRDRIDLARVHFLGKVPYPTFRALMQVSRVHAYLTYPFVLSWSMLEAMAAGAVVVGSRTAPVTEVITDGLNGRLVDFFDVAGWSGAMIECLSDPARYADLGHMARKTVVQRFDLRQVCLPQMVALIEGLVP
jgi:glycosyltransferase involved in cell wall biosynthesis